MDAADMLRCMWARVIKSRTTGGNSNGSRPFCTNSWLGPMPHSFLGDLLGRGAPDLSGAISYPPFPTSDISLPPCSAEDIALPLCSAGGVPLHLCSKDDTIRGHSLAMSITPSSSSFSCSTLDVMPPLSYAEEITPPLCLVEDVVLPSGYAKGITHKKLCWPQISHMIVPDPT